jgi:CheY-like chemotaxis protein
MEPGAVLRNAIVDENLAGAPRAPVDVGRQDDESVQAEMVMRRIVVIDDEPLILRATQRLLQELGHRARTYMDGRVAVELMRWDRPDVVLVDLHMSEMDGIQVLRRVLTLDHPPAVIVMSGDGKTPVKRRLDELGLAARGGYLGKPFTVTELQEALAGAMQGRPSH